MKTDAKAIVRKTPLPEKTLNLVILFTVFALIIYVEKWSFDIRGKSFVGIIIYIIEWCIAYVITIATVILSEPLWRRGMFAVLYVGTLAYLLTTTRI